MIDLVNRAGVAADVVEVVSAERSPGPTAASGVPLAGDAIHPGDLKPNEDHLAGQRRRLRDHSGGGRDVFYCKNPSDPVTGGGYGDV